jgi:hypothetical protein
VDARAQGIRPARPAALARVLRRGLACALPLLAALAAVAQASDPITPLSDIHRGLHCTALTVVQGTTISSFDVDVLDVVDNANDDGSGARILVHVSGPAVDATGIAEGYSGSPVYCPDAQGRIGNAGAISETVGQYGESIGLVTPIQLMLGLRVYPPSSVRDAPQLLHDARPLATPLVVSGLAPSLAYQLRRTAAARGRAVVTAPAGPLGTFAPQPLVPGASVSVMLSSGAIAAGGIGTVTYRDGSTVYAFGHPMDGAGRRALLLGDAYVFTVIGNPLDTADSTSYKLAAPGHTLGMLTDDALTGVVGIVGASPPTIPVTVTVRDRDRHSTLRQLTTVADETDVGNPSGSSALAEVAPLAIAQAVTNAFNGSPGEETGQLCLHVTVREARKPFSFCKRYVVAGGISIDLPPPLAVAMMADANTVLGEIDTARFARLHVTQLTAGVTIERGLRLATILAARGPRTVRPGHTARVKLLARVARGALRTIHLRVAIPRDAPAGTHALRFTGTPLQGVDDGGSGDSNALVALFSILLSGDGGGSGAPQSLSEIADTFSGVAGYDGVRAHLGEDAWRVYRDPRLRLDGSASVTVHVAGHNHGGDPLAGLTPAQRKLLGL